MQIYDHSIPAIYIHTYIHSALIPLTNGTEERVLIREVSLFQGLNCMQELFLGKVFFREVSMQEPFLKDVY